MKRYNKIIMTGVCALAFAAASCDTLDKEPLDIITDKAVWSDPDLIDGYLTECYYQTSVFENDAPQFFSGGSDNFWQSSTGMGVFWINEIADEAMAHWKYNTEAVDRFKAGGIDSGGGLLEWWERSYTVIRMLNEFIDRVPNSPIDGDLRAQRVAEARFLRAYNYFAMVKRYGGVPLITRVQNIDDTYEELYRERNSEKEIYDFVLSELQDIVDSGDLPNVNNAVSGRPTRYAALALISRAALYAGSIAKYGNVQLNGLLGIPQDQAREYFQKSYKASKEIGLHFSLYDSDPDKVQNFKNIFLVKNNNEVIMARHHDNSPASINSGEYSGGCCWGYDFAQCPKPQSWNAGNKDAPYFEMAEEFEYTDGRPGKIENRQWLMSQEWLMEGAKEGLWANKDPRFFATIYTQDTEWKGSKIDFHNGVLVGSKILTGNDSFQGIPLQGNQTVDNTFGTGFGVMKYLDENCNNMQFPGYSSTDYVIFRYGEILLNLAEAAYEIGDTRTALDAINEIRQRAGIAKKTSIDMDAIRHERKVELAFEGHRYWDVRRWRIATTELSKPLSGIRYIRIYNSDPNVVKYKVEILENVDGQTNRPQFQERAYYLPITGGRTGNNPNLVENPGY